jgi:putative acyl-CoA dehydrogenase
LQSAILAENARQTGDSMPGYATHDVLNQPPEFLGFNAFLGDAALRDAVAALGAGWAEGRLAGCGARIGSARVQGLAYDANRQVPVLRTHDRFGNRIDIVEFSPAWHGLMGMLRADEVHALGWTDRPAAHVARAALSYLWSQGEAGVGCPAAKDFRVRFCLQATTLPPCRRTGKTR